MQVESSAIPAVGEGAEPAVPPRDLPPWLKLIDSAMIVLVNIALVVEVIVVFTNTMLRTFLNSSALMGFDETSHPFLISVAFLAGAVSYSRGQFIAIKILLDKTPPAWNAYFAAVGEWVVILVSVLIGGYSVPLLIANAEEKTILLGIGYAWLTLPMTFGSALFVIHAGLSLRARSKAAVALAAAAVAAVLLLFLLSTGSEWAKTHWFYGVLAVLFLVQVAIGVPIGFVLATVGMACVHTLGSGDMMAVVMNAQRGSGGFIFLALPFFVLAGYIMDRADIGARIVNFVASMIGHVRGGLLQVMVVGVYLSSSISGSKAADMATIGIPMNRMLDQHGYPPHERASLLAAAAAMAESVPPSIAMILIGSSTSISIGGLFIAGLLPAATLALLLMLIVYVRASAAGWKPVARAPRREILRTGRRAVLSLLMPVMLIGGLASGIGTPTEVSTFAVIYGLALGLLYGRMDMRGSWQLLTEASLLNGMIFFTISAATIFSWALTLEGVTVAIAQAVSGLGAALFLPAVIVITVLMGALLESFVTLVILAPLLMPVAEHLGVNQLQYGVIMTEAFGIGSILPPIGIALYVSCAICGAKVERATKSLLWYLAVMLLGLLLVAAVPWITTVLPALFNFKG